MSKLSSYLSSHPALRVLLFVIVTLIIGGILLVLPVPIQRILLGFIILIVIGIMPENRAELWKIKGSVQSAFHHLISLRSIPSTKYAKYTFFIGLILIGLSTHFYQPEYFDRMLGFYLFLVSLLFIRLSFPILSEFTLPKESRVVQPYKIRWIWIGVAILAMIALTLMNAPKEWTESINFDGRGRVHEQVFAFCVGLLALLYGFGIRLLPRRFTWERHHTILAGILLIAGFMRLWDLEEAARFFMDEFHFIRGINTIEDNNVHILYPSSNAFTDVFSYLQVVVKTIIGANLTALRIPSALFGIWGVVGIYMLAREFFHVRVALLSAFLLALMPAHIHFSRIGINNIAGAMMGIWCFVYIVRAMRHQYLSDFAVAGILLGLTHYFYEGERLFFTPFIVCWFGWIILFCRRKLTFPLPNLKHLIVFIFCFLVVSTPLYHTIWSQKISFARRFDATRSEDVTLQGYVTDFVFDSQLSIPIQRYVQTSIYDSFYQSEYAYVIAVLVPFFLLGCAILLLQIFSAHGSLFIWWVFGVAFANGLVLETFSAGSPRYVVAIGALMIITAVGIHTVWSVLVEHATDRLKKLVQVGFFVYLGCIGIYQMDYYFATVVPNFHKRVFTKIIQNGRHQPAYDDMMLRAVSTLPDDITLHVFTATIFPHDLIYNVPAFYERIGELDVTHTDVRTITTKYFKDLPHDLNHVFAFVDYHEPILTGILKKYFVVTQIEGSPFDIPDDVEMKFYFVKPKANSS
jgi:hypothetical protein